MKIRMGFVANSSSSSFMIYGIALVQDNIDELEQMINEKGLQLDIEYGCDDEYCYIGRSWNTIKDDETAGQWKQNILKEIQQILPSVNDQDLTTHQEAWYNG